MAQAAAMLDVMQSGIEPRIVTREAPPVAGVRRELMLPFGGKAPRLGGVRAELDAYTENAAPIFDAARAEPDPAREDKSPPVGGVEMPVREASPRTNTATIAAAISVFAHVAVLAWSLHSIRPDEALAKGGDTQPIVVEGVSVILLDQMPTRESPEKVLAEAKPVDETETAPKVVEEVVAPPEEVKPVVEPPTEIAALTAEEARAPVTDSATASAEPEAAMVVPDAVAKPVSEPAPEAATAPADTEASKPVEPETRLALADDASVAPAAVDQSANLAASKAEDMTAAAPVDAVEAKAVETETPPQVEEPPTEVLAKDLPANPAPATDLYLDSVDTADAATEHAPVADEAAKPVEPLETDVAAVDDAEKIAPLEEKADPIDAPEDPRDPQPVPKKTAAVKSAPSKERQASVAEKPAQGPLFGILGAGGTSAVERGSANTSSYRAQLAAHLRRYRSYPDAARDQELTGTVRVSFTVNASGQVTGARLTRSSGHAVLDRAAVGMVSRASPFPPIPNALSVKSLSVDVPVRFDRR